MTATILRATAAALPLADASVDLICTSPPYFALRSYQDGGEHYAGQLGSEPTPAEFVDALIEATREMVRVLKPSGSIWVNLGDKYTGGGGQWDKDERPDPGGRRTSKASGGTRNIASRGKTFGLKPKSLIGIPWRYALRCIDDLGLILRAEVIWAKPNGLPESVTDRVRRSHEQWFHFTVSPRYYSAVDEIREPHQATKQGRSTEGWRPGPSGQNRGTEVGRTHDDGDPLRYFALSPLGKLPGSVWTIPTQPLTVPAHLGIDHFAAFPMEWPRRIIQGWSPRGICTACGEGRRPVVDRKAAPRDLASHRNPTKTAIEGGHNRNDGDRKFDGPTFNRWRAENPETITGYACACTPSHVEQVEVGLYDVRIEERVVYDWHLWTPAPTTPAIVLDPFGGTGTTALVAHALGRHGISIDLSQDYSRLAQWRTTDEGEYARAFQVDKPAVQVDGQGSLLDLLEDA